MTQTLTDLATKLAGLPCPTCKGSGYEYQAVQPYGAEKLDCHSCDATGYLLQGVRMPCPDEECQKTKGLVQWTGAPYNPPGDTRYAPHEDCSGRAYTVSTDLATWLKALWPHMKQIRDSALCIYLPQLPSDEQFRAYALWHDYCEASLEKGDLDGVLVVAEHVLRMTQAATDPCCPASVCTHEPRTGLGQPIGMYHCPECGEMQVAGMQHIPHSIDCETLWREDGEEPVKKEA